MAYNLKRDEIVAIIGGNFSEKELRPLTLAQGRRVKGSSAWKR